MLDCTKKIADQRKDFLHKQSRQITNDYEIVVVESLDLKAMSKTLKLGMSIADNGYGRFVEYLSYKLRDEGKVLVRVDKWYASSKICSCCGKKRKKNYHYLRESSVVSAEIQSTEMSMPVST